jgi:AcrR family transcriptional regulator
VTGPARDRLLDAAVEAAAIHGLAKLSVGDVAKHAGLSRQTLYKHFPSKDVLIAEAVLRETETMVAAITAAAEPFEAPEEALEAAILTTLRLTREHPLLDRLVRTEPEALLPLLITDDGPVIAAVRRVVEAVIGERLPELSDVDRRRAADLLGRVLISYAITPPDDPPEVVAAFLARLTVEGVVAPAGRR